LKGGKKLRKRTAMILFIFLLCFICFLDTTVAEADGIAANTLTINVGYYGGPYYEKKVFSVSELESLGVRQEVYTLMGGESSVVTAHVRGVLLEDIINAARIDLGSVETFHFYTSDKAGGYYTSIPKWELIDAPRYFYPHLPYNYDYDTGQVLPGAAEGGRRVPTMLALSEYWRRWTAPLLEGMFDPDDFSTQYTNTRFRLFFGQTDFVTNTTNRSAKWVYAIDVMLGGAPSLSADESVLELEVGSDYRVTVNISAADPVLSDAIARHLQWSSSNTQVAMVDSSGKISVKGEGSAVITASYGDQQVTFLVNSTDKQDNPKAPGEPDPDDNNKNPGAPDSGNKNADGKHSKRTPFAGSGNDASSSNIYVLQENAKDILGTESAEKVNSILEHDAASSGNTGAVQNWRMYEMADSAVELPVIEEETPLTAFMSVAALFLFFTGMGGEAIWFFVQR
jgi:hypothetical protein